MLPFCYPLADFEGTAAHDEYFEKKCLSWKKGARVDVGDKLGRDAEA